MKPVERCHPGCEFCGDQTGKDERWVRKKKYLEDQGKLYVMRECQWRKKIKSENLRNYETRNLPLLMQPFGTTSQILNGIIEGKLFGFIVTDVTTPDEVIEKIKWLNFPPVIRRESIDETLLTPYMKKRVKEKKYKLPQVSPIQTFHGKQLLIFTPLAKFYLELGLKLSNISQFLQYQDSYVLKKFVSKITNGRIGAKRQRNSELELSYKVIGNSGYGKLGESVKRYTKTKLVDDMRLKIDQKSAFFKDSHPLETEDGEHELCEVDMQPKSVTDNKPLPMAVAILQNSKLHFLRKLFKISFST